MNITEIRIYAEVLEQGLDFRSYVERTGFNGKIKNCYTKKAKSGFSESDSIIDRIRKVKDVDVLISAISNNEEYPLLMIEYSTAVPTDDHRMQRSDVYYWGGKLKVPVMKISSTNKGMNQAFGGGDRITNEQEQRLAYNHGAIFYPIKWDTLSDQDILPTKPNALSCIPFHQGIQNIIQSVISAFQSKNTFDEFYRSLQISYQNTNEKILADTPISVVHGSIVNSTRFFWDKDKLSVKINRFGHALDPERGVLYFANMLVGAKNTITEIQVNRSDDIESRGGYKSLFDGLTHEKELLQYVLDIINYSNT